MTIVVSQTDPFRLDVTVPGEQHFYLRASTSHERQQWLVALGSAKACEGMTKDATIEPGFKRICNVQICFTKCFLFAVYLPVSEEKNNLKSKRSELRLYCDLLMQQVHSVKHAATQAPPDIEVKPLPKLSTCHSRSNVYCWALEIGRIHTFTDSYLRHLHFYTRRMFAAC